MMKNKSYSESEADMLMASTDTLATKKGLQEDIRRETGHITKFLWDPEKKEIMKRTEIEWARLLLFYFCFCAILVAYASIAFGIYLEVCSDAGYECRRSLQITDSVSL